MYHCHFEDVEHVQMGMTGHRVRAARSRTGRSLGGVHEVRLQRRRRVDRVPPPLRDPARTRSGRSYHDGDRDIQESDRRPTTTREWFTLNGRCYPQTIAAERRPVHRRPGITTHNPNYGDGRQQPAELLADPGERRRPRPAAAGQPRLPAARDGAARASRCTSSARTPRCSATATVDTSYWTNTLYIGPGEARDVLFDAPAFDASRPSGSDARGTYNVYYFKNRDWRRLSNNGAPGSRRNDDRGAGVPDRAARPDRREPDLCLSRRDTSGRKPAMTYLTRRLGVLVALAAGALLTVLGVANGAAGRRREGRHGLRTRNHGRLDAHVQPRRRHRLHADAGRQQHLHVELRGRRRQPGGAADVPVPRPGALRDAGPDRGRQPDQQPARGVVDRLPRPGHAGHRNRRLAGAADDRGRGQRRHGQLHVHGRQARARISTRAARTSRSRSRWACTAPWSCARASGRTSPTTRGDRSSTPPASTCCSSPRSTPICTTRSRRAPRTTSTRCTTATSRSTGARSPTRSRTTARRCCRPSRTARWSGSSRTAPRNPQPALIRMLNAGAENHPFHPHGNHTQADRAGRPAAPQRRRHESCEPSTSARRSAPARRSTTCCAGTTGTDSSATSFNDDWNPTTNPFPVAAPNYRNVTFKDGNTWYSGNPYLGYKGTLPTGTNVAEHLRRVVLPARTATR